MRQARIFGIACGAAAIQTPGTELIKVNEAFRIHASLQEEVKAY